MLSKMAGVSDPEKKRKLIGAEFIEVFKAFKADLCARTGADPDFLVQARTPTVTQEYEPAR